MDTHEGDNEDPISLHKFLYTQGDPVDHVDPSGHDIGDIDLNFEMPVLSTVLSGIGKELEAVGLAPSGFVYSVVYVTSSRKSPFGPYEPQTKVKWSGQADKFGLPIGTSIHIPIPPGVDPQTLVNDWATHSYVPAVTTGQFGYFWRPGGPNDYKLISPIYDAFGNFEFGATGAAAGFSYSTLQTFADGLAEGLHGNRNDPINHNDIKSGYDAIAKGGTLSIRQDTLTP